MTSAPKDIVLVGAGHAHVTVLREFGLTPPPGVRLTLISRQVHTPYSGMLPGVIAGVYSVDEAHIDIGPLAAFADARLLQDEVIGLDLAGRRIIRRNGPPMPYDLLSIDIGSAPGGGGVATATTAAIPVKPIDAFLDRFEAARTRIRAAGGKASIAVVGAGAGGIELILALHQRLTNDIARAGNDPSRLAFALVSATAELLPSFPRRAQKFVDAALHQRDIAVVGGSRAVAVDDSGITLANGHRIAADTVFWTTEATPASWLATTGLALDARGFIRIGATLQSVTHPDVFAAGDVAGMDGTPRPKAGVYAVRQGAPLAANLRRRIAGVPLLPHKPQREALYLLATADGRAIGSRNGIVVEGAWVWRWKNRIDRRFMQTFKVLPASKHTPA